LSLEQLEEVRRQVAERTRAIVEAFCQRILLAGRVASLKAELGMPVDDYFVERGLARQVREVCVKYGLDPAKGLKLLNLLVSESVALQRSARRPPATPTSMLEEARRLEEQGSRVIHLEVGEPDFGPPQRVVEAAVKALREGRTRYVSKYGLPELRRALAERMSERWGAYIKPDQVLITPGGRAALALAMSAILTQGDSAIIVEPAWPAYRRCVESLGCRARVVRTRLEDGWELDVGRVEELMDETTKVVIVNSPCNPTGKVLRRRTVEEIVEAAARRGATVLSDEAYVEFSYGERYSLLAEEGCDKVVIGTFSKAWGMTGFRLGYLIASRERCAAIAELAGDLYTCVPEFVQWAGVAALDCFDEVDLYVAEMRRRRELIASLLKPLPLEFREPDGAFYVFFKLKGGMGGEEFVELMLRRHQVALAPGSGFGDYPHFVRLSFCRPEEELREAVARMRELL
jgi:aspartate aminotransferase